MGIAFPGPGAHAHGAPHGVHPAAQQAAQQHNAPVPQHQANQNAQLAQQADQNQPNQDDQFVQQAQQADQNQANQDDQFVQQAQQVDQNQANQNDQFVPQADPNQLNQNDNNNINHHAQQAPPELPDNNHPHLPFQAQLNAFLQNVLNNLNMPLVPPPQDQQPQPLNQQDDLHHINNPDHPFLLHNLAAQAPLQNIALQDDNNDIDMQEVQADEEPGAWVAEPMDVEEAEDPQAPSADNAPDDPDGFGG